MLDPIFRLTPLDDCLIQNPLAIRRFAQRVLVMVATSVVSTLANVTVRRIPRP